MTGSAEISVRELRRALAGTLNDTAVRGRIVYVTDHGRRVAAIVTHCEPPRWPGQHGFRGAICATLGMRLGCVRRVTAPWPEYGGLRGPTARPA
jgi:antitoxin (DNA-binding transcriptional repressor) of toxin-antitoxin stability system